MKSAQFDVSVESLNVCVLGGVIHRAPEWRELPSGSSVTSFDLKVLTPSGKSDVIRVSWMDAPAAALEFEEGKQVLVCGRLRTYWAKRSVTDMAATSVVPLRSVMKVRRNLTNAMVALQEACP